MRTCICGEKLQPSQVACPSCLEDMDKVADIFEGEKMREKTIEVLEHELEVLNTNWQIAMNQATRLIESYAGRQVSTHLGHNLGNRAAELSEIAAKIDQTQRILAYIREGN